jgi:CheY-like chemotaxis protein
VAVKTQFWDNQRPDVNCFLRRRTIDGEWIWLNTKVVSYIDNPVQGVIVEEMLVEDVEHAERIHRIMRVAAILLQAVQSAQREMERKEAARMVLLATESSNTMNANAALNRHHIPLVADDAQAYQTWLQQAAGETGADLSGAPDALKSIMLAAVAGGTIQETKNDDLSHDDPIAILQNELMNGEVEERKGFDPLSALKEVRGEGTRLDLGMVRLSVIETKMIVLVLTGRVRVDELANLVYFALTVPGQSLASVLSPYKISSDRHEHAPQTPPQSNHQITTRKSLNRTRNTKAKPSRPSPLHTSSAARSLSFGDQYSQNLERRNIAPVGLFMDDMPREKLVPANISVINFSYTYMGNEGMEILGELLYMENAVLETLDISFCGLDEKGIIALARALTKRNRRGIESLKGLIVSGNFVTYRAAKDLGLALSPHTDTSKARKRTKVLSKGKRTGYDEDNESDDDDLDDDDGDDFIGASGRKRQARENGFCCQKGRGLQVLHLNNSSLTPESLFQLLDGLGPHCAVLELCLSSNHFGPTGASVLVDFLESKGKANHLAMPYMERLDLSDNDLGNDGVSRLTRAISKRVKNDFVDLRLSCNEIGHEGIQTIMNKLLQHNIVSLSLDKNPIGDQGCQLVAASLPSMHAISRLNLSFNQIGSLGVNTLMKALIGCESITYLGLSGNIMKISGAIAMGFTLAQHPRLEEIELDNCCLSQAAQCHIVAGIISNRWVPMKHLNGFQAGPPMVAIGAIGVFGHNLSSAECFRIKRDEQMKTILQWMESNRAARQGTTNPVAPGIGQTTDSQQQYLTPDFVSTMNEVHGTPSQNAYLRMLGWLSKIPFDEEELTMLRKYFYDIDGGEGDRGSDGYINLKLRGDLLAALDSDVADEIRDQTPSFLGNYKGSVGLDLEEMGKLPSETQWDCMFGSFVDKMPTSEDACYDSDIRERDSPMLDDSDGFQGDVPRNVEADLGSVSDMDISRKRSLDFRDQSGDQIREFEAHLSLSSLSKQSLTRTESDKSNRSVRSTSSSNDRRRIKARIAMFPAFEAKLEELKATAKEMIENESDPEQQDVILTQYAEASLTILRQLRYHCMNSGLDGWRQGSLRRKVLIVDDSLVTRKMVARAFEKANFIVDTAENGVEGVKKLKASIYDIAFMDIDMPVMNGFEATKALRQWEDTQRPGARQPICALTAFYVDDFERSELMKFKEAGLDVMESKPCNIPRLFKVVDDVSPMFSDLSISVSQASVG